MIPIDPLQRLSQNKARKHRPVASLTDEMIEVFNKQIAPKQKKFGGLSGAWAELVPEPLQEHARLGSFTRGNLTVLVDSSAHLYELKQLLLAGLESQLIEACRGAGLRKIVVKRGGSGE